MKINTETMSNLEKEMWTGIINNNLSQPITTDVENVKNLKDTFYVGGYNDGYIKGLILGGIFMAVVNTVMQLAEFEIDRIRKKKQEEAI